MGLDMYAYAAPANKVSDEQTDATITEGGKIDLHYWRKHHDLHGWMHNLYTRKGGKDSDFNCNNVRLNLEDLAELEQAIKANALPSTSGFFFGNNVPDAETVADDMEFIRKAREAIKGGHAVFYDSWW